MGFTGGEGEDCGDKCYRICTLEAEEMGLGLYDSIHVLTKSTLLKSESSEKYDYVKGRRLVNDSIKWESF